jgi:hypothetical protein
MILRLASMRSHAKGFAASAGGVARLLAPLPAQDWLFPSTLFPDRPLTREAVERAFTMAVERIGLIGWLKP